MKKIALWFKLRKLEFLAWLACRLMGIDVKAVNIKSVKDKLK